MSTNSRYPKRTRGIANTGNDHSTMAAANNVDNDPTTSTASAAASRSAFVSSIYSYVAFCLVGVTHHNDDWSTNTQVNHQITRWATSHTLRTGIGMEIIIVNNQSRRKQDRWVVVQQRLKGFEGDGAKWQQRRKPNRWRLIKNR